MTKAPFVVEKCVLLLLRPELLLPEGRPLLINTRRALREPGGPPLSDSDAASWTRYFPHPKKPYLVDASRQEFEEFDFVSKRSREQSLSIFSLLVNANSKLQAADKRKDYPPGTRSYITNVEDAVRAIFFVPRGIQNGGGLADEEPHDLSVEFDDSDNYSEEEEYDDQDQDQDDGPDTINGLTFPEMETVIQRASDGSISAEERTEAAMLMLGMAGGEFCYSLSLHSSSLIPGNRP